MKLYIAALVAAAIAVPTIASAQTSSGTAAGQASSTSAGQASSTSAGTSGTPAQAANTTGMKNRSANVRSSRAEMRTHPVKKHVIIKKHTPRSRSY